MFLIQFSQGVSFGDFLYAAAPAHREGYLLYDCSTDVDVEKSKAFAQLAFDQGIPSPRPSKPLSYGSTPKK